MWNLLRRRLRVTALWRDEGDPVVRIGGFRFRDQMVGQDDGCAGPRDGTQESDTNGEDCLPSLTRSRNSLPGLK